jgi:hypothetical protein
MKQTHHNDPIHSTTTHVIHDAIATRAFELWIRDGKPENQSEANWLEAECELATGRHQPRAEAPRLPVSF